MTDDLTLRRPEGHRVKFRRMRFPFEDGFDKYWHSGSPFLSFFFDALSSAFRPGETFFIDSARAMRDLTDDQALLDEVAEFSKQEGHHTAQHVKFNKMVQAQGVDVDRSEAVFKYFLDRARAKMEPGEMLAVTCALEHFTAGFAHECLSNPRLTEGADPAVLALWRWHAMEEMEHKATCHDLYQQVDGGYLRRCSILIGSWFMILAITMVSTFRMLKADGKLFGGGRIWEGLRLLLGRRGMLTRNVPWFFQYFRPSFHPWQHDNHRLIAEWERTDAKYVLNADNEATAPTASDATDASDAQAPPLASAAHA